MVLPMSACKVIILIILPLLSIGEAAAQPSPSTAKQYNKMANEALVSSQHHRKDSTTAFTLVCQAVAYALKCDSIESADGKSPKFRKANSHNFARPRRMLLSAGDYFISHSNPQKANQALHLYLSSASAPLFNGQPTDTASAAYMLSAIALRQKSYKEADHWANLALTDSRTALAAAEVIAMVMEATMSNAADSAAYAEVLTRLYQTNPESKRYFSWLMAFYENPNQQQNLENFIDRQLANHPDEIMPWILKAELAMKNKRWGEAADTYKHIVDTGVATAPIMFNLGVCLANISTEQAPDGVDPVDPLKCLNESASYLQKAKQLDPERKQVDWKPVLDAVEEALSNNTQQNKEEKEED